MQKKPPDRYRGRPMLSMHALSPRFWAADKKFAGGIGYDSAMEPDLPIETQRGGIFDLGKVATERGAALRRARAGNAMAQKKTLPVGEASEVRVDIRDCRSARHLSSLALALATGSS